MTKKILFLILFLIMIEKICFASWIDEGMTLTKNFEGFKNYSYIDSLGIKTIGYGFNCKFMNKKNQNYITKNEANKIFEIKYQEAIDRAIRFTDLKTWNQITDTEKIVLADLSYNLGNGIFKFKKLRIEIKNQNRKGVIRELKDSFWYQQTKTRSKKIVSMLEKIGD